MTKEQAAQATSEIILSEWKESVGRYHDKAEIIYEWRRKNPNKTMYACWKETGLNRTTIKKWFDNCEERVYESAAKKEKIDFKKVETNELLKETKLIDDVYVVSWNYMVNNRYHANGKEQIRQIRERFAKKQNVIVKPNRIFFFFPEDEKKLSRRKMTELIIAKTYLYYFRVNEAELKIIQEKCESADKISRAKFVQTALEDGLKKLKVDKTGYTKLIEEYKKPRSIADIVIQSDHRMTKKDIKVAVDLDIIYQDINFKLDYVIEKSDIIRFIVLNA